MEEYKLPSGLRDDFETRIYVATFEHALRSGIVNSGFVSDAHDIAVRAVRLYRYSKTNLLLADDIPPGEGR